MTEVFIWIAGSTLLFTIALIAGRFLFQHSAAKRRYLFSASLAFTAAIPLIALGIHALAPLNVPVVNDSLQTVNTLFNGSEKSRASAISVGLDATFSDSNNQLATEAPANITTVPIISDVKEVLLQPIIPPAQTSNSQPTSWSQWLPLAIQLSTGFWLLGALVSLIRLLQSYRKANQILLDGEEVLNGTVFDILRSVGTHVGLRKLPPIYSVSQNISPAVVSPFRPKVIFSKAALEQLNHEELRAILTHELSHIKRHDLAQIFTLQIILAFHWFNPLAYRVFQQFRICQEELCDIEVTQSNNQFIYARLLIKINQMFAGTEHRCALAAISCKKIVGRRVSLLLDENRDSRLATGWIWRTGSTTLTLLLCLVVGIATAAVHFQPLAKGKISRQAEEDLEALTYELLTQWHVDGNLGKLSWKHVPYLLKHIDNDNQIKVIPVHPLSSESQDDCTVGTAAMWFIDMICCERIPALNPIFHTPGSDQAPSQAEAAQSFRSWWEMVKDWPASEARRVNPLMFCDLVWQGGRDMPDYSHSPRIALNNFFSQKKVVSVSPNGTLVFIADRAKEKPVMGTLSRITSKGLVEQWQVEDFEVEPVFTLDSGLLLKTADPLETEPSPPHLEFIKEGQVIEAVDLTKLIVPELEQVKFELEIQLDKDRLRINAKFKHDKKTFKNSFLFDQNTGNLLETQIPHPNSEETTKITAELHLDEQIQELASFDIDKISNTDSILRAPVLDVVPAGKTRTRGEVFDALNLNENLTARFRHKQQGNVILLIWQVSPSYDIILMTGAREPVHAKLELDDPNRKVYGVRLLPTQKRQ